MSEEITFTHVKRVGVELEGGWGRRVFLKEDIHEDISVPACEGHYGEIASSPLLPEEVEPWVLKHYPLEIPQPTGTKSCGLHVHLSFYTVEDYCKVLSPTFYRHYLGKILEWGHEVDDDRDRNLFLNRLHGRNRFARRLYVPTKQVGERKKDSGQGAERRTLINYCYGLHGTVEVRLFPMFAAATVSASAVERTMEIFESFLKEREGRGERKVLRKLSVGEALGK